MPAMMQPVAMRRTPAFVAAQQGRPAKPAVVPRTSDTNCTRIAAAGKAALLGLPALVLRVPSAFADEIEQAGESARQALTQVPADKVPQWSQVRVPEGIQAPGGVANLFGGNVNPLLLLGAVAAIAVPALLFQALSPGGKAKGTSAGNALSALAEEPRTQLVDIRSPAAVKAQGNPDLSATRRRSLSLPFTKVVRRGEPEEEVPDWGSKLAKLSALKPDSIVILLDADGKSAAKAAAQVPADAVDEIFYVNGGADGWEKSGAPWREPGRGGFSLPGLGGVGEALAKGAGTLKVKGFGKASTDGDDAGGAAVSPGQALLGGAAVLGGALLLTNGGALLELVGVAAAAQLVSKNFLFAQDRERTTKALREFVDDKVAVKDVGQDLQKISNTLLEGGEDVAGSVGKKAQSVADDAPGKLKEAANRVGSAAKEATGKAEKQVDKASDKVGSAAKEATGKAEKQVDKASDKVGSAAKEATGQAEKQVDKAAEKVDKASNNGTSGSVGDAAQEAQQKAEEAKGEAKGWIDAWRSKQK